MLLDLESTRRIQVRNIGAIIESSSSMDFPNSSTTPQNPPLKNTFPPKSNAIPTIPQPNLPTSLQPISTPNASSNPPTSLASVPISSQLHISTSRRDSLLKLLRSNLWLSKQRMHDMSNRHSRDVSFQIGDKVLLHLQLQRQHSLACRSSAKLSRCFCGTFTILDKFGDVQSATATVIDALPKDIVSGHPCSTPDEVLRELSILCHVIPEEQWLIWWSYSSIDDATWEPANHICSCFL